MTTHREMMYDPQTSNRRFKWFMRLTRSPSRIEEAHMMGEYSLLNPNETPRRWRRNPFPPGRRHDAYEEGRRSALAEIEHWKQEGDRERSRYRR